MSKDPKKQPSASAKASADEGIQNEEVLPACQQAGATNQNYKKCEEFQTQLDEIKKKSDEYLGGWKRERAELLNYKNEEIQRIGQLMKYASQELILKMLPILDNFEIAEKHVPEKLKSDEHVKGVLQIGRQIKDLLKSQGIEEIKTIGEKFDPNFMEAIAEVEDKDKESNIVVEEMKKGYKLYDKIIRPAKVKVTK